MEVGGDPLAAMYLWHSVSTGTRNTYAGVVEAFKAFCRHRGWPGPDCPAQPLRVEAWIAAEAAAIAASRGLSKKTLKRKVYALASWHTDLGLDGSLIASPRVERIIAGANRYHGVSTKAQPLPITLPILRRVVQEIRDHPSSYGGPANACCLAAAFCLAFACFLRMGELVYDTFDPRFDLRRDSIIMSDTDWRLKIPASKNDPFRLGVTVVIPDGPPDVCPRRALQQWLTCRPEAADAPLFDTSRQPFRRTYVCKMLSRALANCGYASALYSGHSFRRGAATWAASIGMSATDIKTLGRWNSDCYRLYVDAGPSRTAEVGHRFLTSNPALSSLPVSGIPLPGDVWRPSV